MKSLFSSTSKAIIKNALTFQSSKMENHIYTISLTNKNNSIMKTYLFVICAFFILSFVSCDKDNEVQQLESINTETTLNFNSSNEEPLLERGRNFWMDKCFQRFSSEDQKAIEAARQANNQAIKEQDAPAVASNYLDNFFILTSTNGLFTGKDVVEGIYQSVFNSREDVIFVRTPTAITVNNDWNMASENGNWIGTWVVDGVNIEVGGDYYAKWHKIDGVWKLRSEIYTQFDCSGEVVCNNKPNLE